MSVISLNPDWCIHSIYPFLFIYFIKVICKKVVLFIKFTGCATQITDSLTKNESGSEKIRKIVCRNEAGMTRFSKVDAEKL